MILLLLARREAKLCAVFDCAAYAPASRLARQVQALVWLLKPDHTRLDSGAQNHLQTTWLLVTVLYSVEQPPHCDLLRLSC